MPEIKIISSPLPLSEIKAMAENQFGYMVKVVVDIDKRIMTIGGDMHADEEALMLSQGSEQKNLWGINIYPDQHGDDRVEFDSMINIRAYLGNYSRSVDDIIIQKKIIEVVNQLIK